MDKRVISAIIAIPLLLFFVIMGGAIFKVGVFAMIAIALYEYTGVYNKTGNKAVTWVFIAGYALNLYLVISGNYNYMLPLIYVIVLCSMAAPIFSKRYNAISSVATVSGYIYIVNFFSLLILIRDLNNGFRLIWLVFIISWFSDTFAYYCGRAFGKRKLCPEVSPKKTVEGFIGGIFGSLVGVILWGYFNQNLHFIWYQLALLGVIGSAVSVLGDLSASLLKRYAGVKDYGNIMPGHGGILDRFDSILFTVPIVYYYILLFMR